MFWMLSEATWKHFGALEAALERLGGFWGQTFETFIASHGSRGGPGPEGIGPFVVIEWFWGLGGGLQEAGT